MKATEFKVGDVWKIIAHNHYAIPVGVEFEVVEVDEHGNARSCSDHWVAYERIAEGSIELVSRLGE